ncbi:MAG: ammonium transporter [Phenylobacterium sp.]|uniref:ammonium transporter n=1 Tax=Phenylobacterium sp. TaxID=1871053 RepID=UPI002730E27E|nr:ammonium transporter [Phenylobacterium sp.]MDP2009360.1 ammonium transporter [Phenylobacterium sp.]MDP3633162.1 ammonium transporter [Phenylobacterium sp.]MDP3870684.1 ammonium transporter [Phenylobacterium sp.]
MKTFGFKRLAGLLAAATLVGAPLAFPAFAQDAAPPAAEAAAPAPEAAALAPEEAPAAEAPAAAEAAPALLAHQVKLELDGSGTAWILTSTALVLMMTIPGLALFYGGMVRRKNVIATVAQSFAVTCVVTIVWMAITYSMAFGVNPDENLNKYVGSFDVLFLNGVTTETAFASAKGLPEMLWIVYQMTFAIITPALIAGAFAERMKFSALLLFTALWAIFVYAPVCHWVWGGGWLSGEGVLDFAGGTVVHINAGVAGLMCALVLGKRKGYGAENMAPSNLVYTMIGASLLWVGWFGFNAGSEWAADGIASAAMLNTQIAAAAAALAWMIVEWVERKKPGMLGLASGAVAGLVAITPAAGFVNPQGALIIGIIGGGAAYVGAVWLKRLLKYDDSLDAFGVHGIAGIVGALLTGALADPAINSLGEGASVAKQALGIVATIAWSGVVTLIILFVVKFTTGLRVSEEGEVEGLDLSLHGEALHE